MQGREQMTIKITEKRTLIIELNDYENYLKLEEAKELYKELGKIFEPKDGTKRQTALDMADKAIKEAYRHWDPSLNNAIFNTSITTSHCEMHGVFYGSLCPGC